MMATAALLVSLASAQIPLKVETFANRPTTFQMGAVAKRARDEGATIVQYRLDERAHIEARLSEDLGRDPGKARVILTKRLDENPEWIERLTHSAMGQTRAMMLGISRFPAVVIADQIYYTDHLDEAIVLHRKAANAR